MSRREIIYAVQSLEELGELRVKRGIGRGNPNVYELPFVGSWLEKVQSLHQLADAKGALKMRKGAISARKGAISAPKSDLTPLDTVISETERLEPSKVLKVKDILIRSCIPEPPKTQTEQQLLAKLKRDRERLKELGYLQ